MSSSPPTDSPPGEAWRAPSWLPKSLTSRLTLTMIALVAVVSFLVASVTTLALRQFLLQRLDDQLIQNSEFAWRAFEAPGGFLDLCGSNGQTNLVVPGALNSLTGTLDADCRQVVVLRNSPEPLVLSAANLSRLDDAPIDQPETVDLDGVGSYRVIVTEREGHMIVTGLPTDEVDATIGRLIGWEALVALLGVLTAAGAALVLVRRQLAPLRDVAATARKVTQLPLEAGAVGVTVRVPEDLTDPATEVGQVGEALNRMLSHVEAALDARHESEQQVRQFVADASHELRTPLSTIQGYAELTRRAESDEPALRNAMERVETESGRMATLVDDLLLLARLDAGRPLDQVDVDVTLLAAEAVNDVRVVDPERHWRLSLPSEPVRVVGDEQRLHQVLTNVLSNARRHTGPGTTVTVSISADDAKGSVQIEVNDDGPGMPEELRGKEFERFSRGDSSRTRESGGAGLGLAIVKAIVEAHGGDVTMTSVPGDTTIVVVIPQRATRS